MGKIARVATAGTVVFVLGTGCSSGQPTADACVDWVRFEDPRDQFDKAELVAVGKALRQDGETSIYSYAARTHLIEIETVLKGEPGQGPIQISSMPQTCTGGESYPDGDPLDTNQRVLIYATKQADKWFTMTPDQSVAPYEQGSPLPVQSSYTTSKEGEQREWTPDRMRSASPEPMPRVP